MAKTEIKLKVQKLRKQGNSIKSIANKLDVSIGSVSAWCRDIKLSKKQTEQLLQNSKNGAAKGRLRAAEKKRAERLERIANLRKRGVQEVGALTKREFFIAGIALYWGEGFKTDGNNLGFAVGDKDIAEFLILWMERFMNCQRNNLQLRLTLNEKYKNHQNRIKKFWIQELNLPKNIKFQKTMFINSQNSKNYNKGKDYCGTIRIILPASTNQLRLVKGWIEGLYLMSG